VGSRENGFSGDEGPAVDAQVGQLTGVAVDDAGNIYFIDNGNGRIRRIDAEEKITTIAGARTQKGNDCFRGEESPATQAIFCGPEHLDVDAAGNVYVADTYNHRIRVIDTNGIITTIAGSGVDGYSGDGGSALEAYLSEPSGIAVGPDGDIYIADSANNRVRKVVL
jgi:trimeric autotransporter adhesin